MKIWFNGKLSEEDKVRIPPTDRGFLLGDGVFDTILSVDGRLMFFEHHYLRLCHDAEVMGIPVEYDEAALRKAIARLLKANGLDENHASVRITLTRGSGPRGLLPPEEPQPLIMITADQYRPPKGPAKAIIASHRRNEGSELTRIKSLSYTSSILARMEAARQHADEAVMLNNDGMVTCATAANIFIVEKAGRVVTPPPLHGALPGVTRKMVIKAGRTTGMRISEGEISMDRLHNAEEAFLTNSLVGIRRLSFVGYQAFSLDGKVTKRIAAAYEAMIRWECEHGPC